MAVHQIDDLQFSFLRGTVPSFEQKIERIVRKGRDEAIRRFTGVRSDPFTLVSVNAHESYLFGQRAITVMEAKVRSGALVLIKDDYNYDTTDQLRVIVHAVRPVVQRARTIICGQLNAGFNFEVRALWTLEFVRSPVPAEAGA